MATGMLGQWNLDESRYARERQHPTDYLKHSYYENWLAGVSKLLVEKGLLTVEELNQLTPHSDSHAQLELQIPTPADAMKILTSGGPTSMESGSEPAFSVGESARVKKIHSTGHTRAPAYVQGTTGTIARLHGCHVFPDSHSQGKAGGEHLYSVRFSADTLWGTDQENSEVLIDLWEPYLEHTK
jgi:nitrile hydratase